MIHSKVYSKIIGILFLAAFPLYGIGNSILVESASSAPHSSEAKLGLFLVLANSVDVFIIGYLIQRIVASIDKFVANIYVSVRILEASLLAVYSFLVYDGVDAQSSIYILYRIAMIGLAMGSFPLLKTLMQQKQIRLWLGWFGIIGYLCVFVGMVMDSIGYTDLGLLLMIPGALFEITFGIWFIARGLPLESNYEIIL